MRRRRDDERFEIVGTAAPRSAPPKRAISIEGPALVPVRVIPSAASLTRRSGPEQGLIEVALVDGTQFRFPADVSAAFVIEVITALRSTAC